MSKYIGTSIAVGHNDRSFNDLTGPCFNILNAIGVQNKVVPCGFMIGEMLYSGREGRRGANLKGQLPKHERLTLHKQAFYQRKRSDGSTRGIEDCCNMRTTIRSGIIAN